jgi:phospholipid transport system substrate-binding protein
MSRLHSPPSAVLSILGAAFLTLSTISAAVAQAETKPDAKPVKASKAAKRAPKAAKADAVAEKTADKPGAKADPPPTSASPMAELKKSNEKLDKILQKNRPNWSPEAELQRAEVRKVVGSFLDYAELARRALSRHWDSITVKQRNEFVETLRELVERSYLKQVHGNANYNIKYDKETKQDSEAVVTGVLNTMARGKKVKIALEYKMLWKGDHWVVYDVVTDEQSMLENYRAEFNKIINKEGFDALLRRMKKKLDEKEE